MKFASVCVFALLVLPVFGQAPVTLTEEGVISGTMDIDFETRSKPDKTGDLKAGSPALGTKDTYKLDITVAKTTQFNGVIARQPKLFSSILGRTKQNAQLFYSVDLSVLNPADLKQRKTVGKWVGTVPVDPDTGAYDLAGGKATDSALRVNVDALGRSQAFVDAFNGILVGKTEKKEGLLSSVYSRVVNGKEVTIKVLKSDPMRFENMLLAMGPATSYPKATVSGRLDYDYEVGNYIADNIVFRYTLDGQSVEDVVTGSIKWVKEKDYDTSGKSYYEFNLRFNEAKNKGSTGEGAAFEKMSDEDAFFAVDNTVPSLTGRVSYVDTGKGLGGLPTNSKVTYSLNANKLTKQQIMNFFKLWMICVSPTNDE